MMRFNRFPVLSYQEMKRLVGLNEMSDPSGPGVNDAVSYLASNSERTSVRFFFCSMATTRELIISLTTRVPSPSQA